MNARERLLKSDAGKIALNLIASDAFEIAADVTMQTLADNLTTNGADPATASANHYRLDGAIRFLALLKKICAAPEAVEKLKTPDLNYKA